MIPFREFLERIRPAVNRRIAETAGGEADIDPGVFPLLLKGKRMRAGLLLYIHAGLAPAAAPTRQALDLACAVELAHAASLILDDMLDGDTTRRGAPSLHLTRGNGRAVLDAVGILALPYGLAAPYGAGYVTMLASAQRRMARGVAWEMLGGPDLPAAELYDAVVARKTGCLFSLAAAWGAMATGKEHAAVAAFSEFGLAAGKAMQVADDITDLRAPGTGARDSRPGSEALLLRCVPENNGTRQALGRILEREVSGAAARIADAGRRRVPPEAWEPFGKAVRDIVGLTMGEEVLVG
ncbi:polyprenyl synthetase [Methanoculleus sp. FWC-SCC3]|uniref:Polyprenyl synthetase n=1 Tax=Methanoculleus methanifontis TaxID=2584086 RepID=A0ABT8M2K5_9EURY|nr:polyprenyl synthetase family protein [Methanoculleus sp. FWC-SCC3]MDN7012586.1 polyprenyl synthetase [Methanoculleus sp. FWC-SCC3]